MIKHELVAAVAERMDCSNDAAAAAVDAVISSMVDTIRAGGSIRLAGFGAFEVVRREGREGRNPRTGQPIQVPAKRAVRFSASAQITSALNGG